AVGAARRSRRGATRGGQHAGGGAPIAAGQWRSRRAGRARRAARSARRERSGRLAARAPSRRCQRFRQCGRGLGPLTAGPTRRRLQGSRGMRIAIFGAGAWGTALAVPAARRHPVMLWARDGALVASLRAGRRNDRYRPGVTLAAGIGFTDDAAATCEWLAEPGSLAVVATPVAGLRATLRALDVALPDASVGVVWLCKGIEASSGRLPHEGAAEELHRHEAGVLSGPSFAQEVAAGRPVALTVASASTVLQSAAVDAFHHGPAR